MVQFEFITGSYVNKDTIKEFYHTKRDELTIKYKDGTIDTVPYAYLPHLEGARTIMQVIPCVKQLYAVFQDQDGFVGEDILNYLCLCADGKVHGLLLCEGDFMITDEIDNLKGLYEESQNERSKNSGSFNTGISRCTRKNL